MKYEKRDLPSIISNVQMLDHYTKKMDPFDKKVLCTSEYITIFIKSLWKSDVRASASFLTNIFKHLFLTIFQ